MIFYSCYAKQKGRVDAGEEGSLSLLVAHRPYSYQLAEADTFLRPFYGLTPIEAPGSEGDALSL